MGGGGGRGGQGGGQGMGGAQPQQQQQRSFDVNFIGATGYITFDEADALKKIKVKKDPAKEKAVVEVLNQYTIACQDLVDLHRKELDILEFAKENLESAQGNMTAMREVMMGVRESNRVVKPKLIEIHLALNEKMGEILNEKELKGWNKYYKSVCKENSFDPEPPKDPRGERGDGPPDGEGPPPEGKGPIDSEGRPSI